MDAAIFVAAGSLLFASCATTNIPADDSSSYDGSAHERGSSGGIPGRNTVRERRITLYEGDEIVNIARQYLGTPYKFGGTSPSSGFDCSGLVEYVYEKAGYRLPHSAGKQYGSLTPVRVPEPGDLLFFKINGRSVSHVGIYAGNYRFIHAPRTGKKVSYADMRNSYWRKRYAGARSFFR